MCAPDHLDSNTLEQEQKNSTPALQVLLLGWATQAQLTDRVISALPPDAKPVADHGMESFLHVLKPW